MFQFHPYHMVFLSPWPIFMAGLTLFMFSGTLINFSFYSPLYFMSFFILLACSYCWWRDVSSESSLQGFHSSFVFSGMRYGMILFIISEVLFFVSFFWAFFHSSLNPHVELGSSWPPLTLSPINPFDVPLLNSVILLSSGITATYSHHMLIQKDLKKSFSYLFLTVLLGLYFTFAQGFEYLQSDFTIRDSSFGSCFFVATGFHGFHVLLGTIFLLVSLTRMKSNFFSQYHHVGLESSIWYWHFVDVVWLFLFVFMYWWVY